MEAIKGAFNSVVSALIPTKKNNAPKIGNLNTLNNNLQNRRNATLSNNTGVQGGGRRHRKTKRHHRKHRKTLRRR